MHYGTVYAVSSRRHIAVQSLRFRINIILWYNKFHLEDIFFGDKLNFLNFSFDFFFIRRRGSIWVSYVKKIIALFSFPVCYYNADSVFLSLILHLFLCWNNFFLWKLISLFFRNGFMCNFQGLASLSFKLPRKALVVVSCRGAEDLRT